MLVKTTTGFTFFVDYISIVQKLRDRNGKPGEAFVQRFCAGFVMDSPNKCYIELQMLTAQKNLYQSISSEKKILHSTKIK